MLGVLQGATGGGFRRWSLHCRCPVNSNARANDEMNPDDPPKIEVATDARAFGEDAWHLRILAWCAVVLAFSFILSVVVFGDTHKGELDSVASILLPFEFFIVGWCLLAARKSGNARAESSRPIVLKGCLLSFRSATIREWMIRNSLPD